MQRLVGNLIVDLRRSIRNQDGELVDGLQIAVRRRHSDRRLALALGRDRQRVPTHRRGRDIRVRGLDRVGEGIVVRIAEHFREVDHLLSRPLAHVERQVIDRMFNFRRVIPLLNLDGELLLGREVSRIRRRHGHSRAPNGHPSIRYLAAVDADPHRGRIRRLNRIRQRIVVRIVKLRRDIHRGALSDLQGGIRYATHRLRRAVRLLHTHVHIDAGPRAAFVVHRHFQFV